MTDHQESVTLSSLHARELFAHCVLLGAAALSEAAGVADVRIGWTSGMRSHPVISGDGLTVDLLAEVVHEHVQRCAASDSWLHRALPLDPQRGLMSPRIGGLGDDRGAWQALQSARHDVEDRLDASDDLLSLAMVGALGEPAYWRRNHLGQRLQDDGASRLEMQPRNQGSEFIGSRLRPLAAAVARRTPEQVRDGLSGHVVIDEMGKGAADSRTATNLRLLGPTDSALAWVALWGISQVPLVHRTGARSATATHVRRTSGDRHGSFVLPLWPGAWRPAKVRALLASRRLAAAGEAVIAHEVPSAEGAAHLAALRRTRGVEALVVFPVAEFGSTSAPERRAMNGVVHPLPE